MWELLKEKLVAETVGDILSCATAQKASAEGSPSDVVTKPRPADELCLGPEALQTRERSELQLGLDLTETPVGLISPIRYLSPAVTIDYLRIEPYSIELQP